MWNVKTTVIPVVIEATGAISKSFRKYVSNIPGTPRISGTAENGYFRHCTRSPKSADVEELQN